MSVLDVFEGRSKKRMHGITNVVMDVGWVVHYSRAGIVLEKTRGSNREKQGNQTATDTKEKYRYVDEDAGRR